ncbi:MAG: DUF3598 family protein [Cyanobacteria bacterium P01_F01_bin.3]
MSSASKSPLDLRSPLDFQWACIRQNIGTWHGSFSQFSPTGELVKDTPSVLTLEETEPDKTMELTLERFPKSGEKTVNRLTFTAPGPAPYTYYFESGAFSQGSSQWSSFGQFATEFSLKIGDKRVRYVIMYESTSSYTSVLKYVTLICETPEEDTQFVEETLTAENLLGTWKGEAEVIYATGEPFTIGVAEWQLSTDLMLVCQEQFDEQDQRLSVMSDTEATLSAKTVLPLKATTNDQLDYQLMLLPNGAYCLLPQEIKRETAFRFEVGWVSAKGNRQRLIRYYDTRGVWMNSALINDKQTTLSVRS